MAKKKKDGLEASNKGSKNNKDNMRGCPGLTAEVLNKDNMRGLPGLTAEVVTRSAGPKRGGESRVRINAPRGRPSKVGESAKTARKIRSSPAVPVDLGPKSLVPVTCASKASLVGQDMEQAGSAAKVKDQFMDQVGRLLGQHTWYHGFMPRLDIEAIIKDYGDFVVRRTTIKGVSTYILSVGVPNSGMLKCSHVPILMRGGQWCIYDIKKATIMQLIKQLQENPCVAISSHPGSLLRRPVPRPDFFILHEDINIGVQIGKGAFGEVHKGFLKTTIKSGSEQPVAIKMLRENISKKQLDEFFKEGRLMMRLHHPNIVRLYGVAPGDQPVLIVLEMAAGGSLKSYCKKNDPVPGDQLLNFAKDACRGMTYLQAKKIIHRDLAARNCLLSERAVLKISDFGLSHHGESLQLNKLQSVPVKWLSPETLKEGKFSHRSDVWSYGMLLWEIYARCKTDPFPGRTNAEARALIDTANPPLEPPPGTPEVVLNIMHQCWIKNSMERPDFEGIFKFLLPSEISPLVAEAMNNN